ncbi:hypothetical protein GXY_14932 [Novacetimonas hansenii ATCC 23769]|uniref:Uncharacterized protein n=1 Tax=Novacetimonas hansenii ATCC 23769 TaxID=714995 RepID=D5QIK5_NOVHA|nr:hypothetical protein GXY_14932 [Novacetimonas hansenii ATCC 23769]
MGAAFFQKKRRLSKLFGKSFTKNLYDFRMLSRLTFQTVALSAAPPGLGGTHVPRTLIC